MNLNYNVEFEKNVSRLIDPINNDPIITEGKSDTKFNGPYLIEMLRFKTAGRSFVERVFCCTDLCAIS